MSGRRRVTGSSDLLPRVVAILIVTLVVVSLAPARAGGSAPAASAMVPAGLTAAEWAGMREMMAAARYQVSWQVREGEWAYRAPNPAQGFALAFGAAGLRATRAEEGKEGWTFGLALQAYGERRMAGPLGREGLVADRTRVEYRRGEGVTEWYENGPAGVEHGLTLAVPPESGGTEAVLTFRLEGSLRARLEEGGRGLLLENRAGQAQLRYDRLRVTDAEGRELAVHMELGVETGASASDRVLRIVVDARAARYPLMVDPLLYSEVAVLWASDRQAGDYFGSSVAIDGDTVVVGAGWENGGAGDPAADAGAAYVFTRNRDGADAWGQVRILRASDRQAADSFGTSVAVSGDVVVVGAPYEDGGAGDPLDKAGAAYIFTRNRNGADAWGQVAILRASDRQAGDYFGVSVGVSGDTAVVGAAEEDGGVGDPAAEAGAAYVFTRNEGGGDAWGEVAVLRASDLQTLDFFGSSVAISGDTAVVGAHGESGGAGDPATGAGAAYVFTRNRGGADAWGEVVILRASDRQIGDGFGDAVAISGDTAVVGAPYEDGGAGDPVDVAGAAYVFTRNRNGADAWGEVAILHASDRQSGDFFGNAVAIGEGTAVVGADGEDGGAGDPLAVAGAAYIFAQNQNGAGAWGEVAVLRASDRQTGDLFGNSVAISGDTAVVGAPFESGGPGDPLANAGVAYTFVGSGDAWGEVATVRASDRQGLDNLGRAVAISGDTAVVGAPFESGGPGDPLTWSGAAYVFRRNRNGADAWGEVAILRASDGQTGDAFGRAVAISGDTVVVGAPLEDGGAGDPLDGAGAAYVFRRNRNGADAWGEMAVLRASDRQVNDQFGGSVAVSGDTVVVGAGLEDGGAGDPLADAGAAYVFTRNKGGADAWGEEAILRASDRQAGDQFGDSVAISGDTAIVGADGEDGGAGDPLDVSGAAYIFSRNRNGADAWGEVRILHASDGQAADGFGYAVAISGDTVVVGAPFEDGGAGDPLAFAGAAYVFTRNEGGGNAWGEVAIRRASDRQMGDEFGLVVAISGDTAIVGAPYEDGGAGDPLDEAGTAYVFTRNEGGADAWGEEAVLRASGQQAFDHFGRAVAISGDTAVVGAVDEDGGAGDPLTNAGAAYVFGARRYQIVLPLVLRNHN